MHAVLVNLAIEELDSDLADLRDRVVPRVSRAPGFVTGVLDTKGQYRAVIDCVRLRRRGQRRG
jgi:hypothetical protein